MSVLGMISEVVVVALPVTVESELPGSRGRKADDVAVLRVVQEVCDDYHVVRRSPLVPAMESENLAWLVQMINLGVLATEAACAAVEVPPQTDEVVVEPHDAMKLFPFLPVVGDGVGEPSTFEEFLPLEQHGDAWGRKDQRGGQRRSFSCIPAFGVVRADFLRHACPAVSHFVVRFRVDDPVEGVVIVAKADGVADGGQRSLLVVWRDHGLANGVDEHGVPLRLEPGTAGAHVLSEPLVVLKILGDRDSARVSPRDLAVDPLEQAPPIG